MERILVIHTLCFAGGIAAGGIAQIPPLLPLTAALLVLLFAAAFFRRREGGLCLIIFSFLVGMAWGQVTHLAVSSFPLSAESTAEISGMVAGRPTMTATGQSFPLRVANLAGVVQTGRMKVQVLCAAKPLLNYGDMVQISGKVLPGMTATNPHQFDYAAYLQRQGIAATVSALYGGKVQSCGENRGFWLMKIIYRLRDRMEIALSCLPRRQNNFVTGMLFGDKGGLSFQERNVLSETGLMDAFAVSGMHMGFVVLLAGMLAGSFSLAQWQRLILISATVAFYCLATGCTASVVRSGLMAVIGLLAYLLNSRKDLATAMAAAALGILIASPGGIFDAGFQLSFVAAWGVISLTPILAPLIPLPAPWREILAGSLAAQLSLAPLIAYYFNVISLAGMMIALIVAWPVGLVIFLGLISLFLAMVSIPLATLPLYGAGVIVELIWQGAKFVDQLPGSHFVLATPAIGLLLLYYGFLLSIPLIPQKGSGQKYCLGLAGLLFVMFLLPPGSDHRLVVTFVDVGQGDCIFIQSPNRRTVLIDGGGKPQPSTVDIGQRVVIPFLKSQGIDQLDLVINTHPHDDHLLGLQTVISEMAVGGLVIGDNFSAHPVSCALTAQARQKKAAVYAVVGGQSLVLEPGVVLDILNTGLTEPVDSEEEENNGSLVIRLSYGEISFLFCGDAELSALQGLMEHSPELQAQVLKLSHHGSRDGFSPDFYQAVSPKLVVITVGRNSFGHPAEQVTGYWKDQEVPIYRTDWYGAVTVSTDGQQLFVQTVNQQE